MAAGVSVRVWYCGLSSPELHIDRVAARVARGGHDIPEHKIYARYGSSMHNLCRLAPGRDKLAVYDNSMPLRSNGLPAIRKLVFVDNGKVMRLEINMPDWAQPMAAVCLQYSGASNPLPVEGATNPRHWDKIRATMSTQVRITSSLRGEHENGFCFFQNSSVLLRENREKTEAGVTGR